MPNEKSLVFKHLDETEITRAAENIFPDKYIFTGWSCPESGLFNTTYFLEYNGGDLKAVLRVGPVNIDRLMYFETKMMSAEPYLYTIMEHAGVPVPRVIKYDGSLKLINREYIVMEFIEGFNMGEMSLGENEKSRIYDELGRYTAMIHSVKGDKFGWPRNDGSIEGYSDWYTFLMSYMEDIFEKSIKYKAFSKNEIENFRVGYMTDRNVFDIDETPVLVHNDLWEPNILLGKSHSGYGIKALIDPDRAMYADREFEFVLWGAGEDFLNSYGHPLDMSHNGIKKREYYKLSLNIMAAYVFKAEYNNENAYHRYYTKSIAKYNDIISS